MSPTLVPSTAAPTTSSPSSSYPSLSPSTVFIISTIAGTGSIGYSGDNGPATAATLYANYGVALDSLGNSSLLITILDYAYLLTHLGNIYIGDFYNHRIRKVTVSTGIITTVAGSSTSGSYSGDNGQATSAGLFQPVGVTLDAEGN